MEKTIFRVGNCPKNGAWTVCRFKRGLDKKGAGVLEGVVDTPMYTMISDSLASGKRGMKFLFN